jgi:phosphatidylglycerophosphatase A
MAIEHPGGPSSSDVPRSIPFFPRLFATVLFAGYIPGPSGTWGSLLGAGCYALVPGIEQPLVLLPFLAALFFAGVYASGVVADRTGHHLTKASQFAKSAFQPDAHAFADPSIVVIDEFVGMWCTMLLLPKTLPVIILAFFLFRAYDIVKPFPARQLERVPRGWGIMLDDLVAAIYANVSTQVLLLLVHALFPQLSMGWAP